MSKFIAWLKMVFDITDTVVTKLELYPTSLKGNPIWLRLKNGDFIVLDQDRNKELGIELGDEVLIVVRKGAVRK